MNKRIKIYSLLAGVVFLLSGMAKALDVGVFASVIAQYGVESLGVAAPLIALAEVALGLLLAFRIWARRAALGGAALLLAFTLAYAYGVAFKGVEDCGCFGQLTALNTSPALTFLRNAVLLYLLVAVWRKGSNSGNTHAGVAETMLAVMCLSAFTSGYTYRHATPTPTPKRKHAAKAVADTPLKEFISTSKDSTYLVFVFSYTCNHCLNSIENLKQYESSGAVDRVVGIALQDSTAEQKFREIFKPAFAIKNYPAPMLTNITSSLPIAYYIKNDTIVAKLSGTLPCGYVFAQRTGKLMISD
jgi:uncharacterized membrane protein YphA (DoxX/SURF4 family)